MRFGPLYSGGDTNINEAVDGNVKLPRNWEETVRAVALRNAIVSPLLLERIVRMPGLS